MSHRLNEMVLVCGFYICLTFSGISSDIFFLMAHRNSLPDKSLTNSIWNISYLLLIGMKVPSRITPDDLIRISLLLYFLSESHVLRILDLEICSV